MAQVIEEPSEALASLTLYDSPCTLEDTTTTLLSLPDELLLAVFDHFDRFILPPLNRQLLPFHRAQRFKHIEVYIGKQFNSLLRALESNPELKNLVKFLIFLSPRSAKERTALDVVIALCKELENLKMLDVVCTLRSLQTIVPQFFWFEGKSSLVVRIYVPQYADDFSEYVGEAPVPIDRSALAGKPISFEVTYKESKGFFVNAAQAQVFQDSLSSFLSAVPVEAISFHDHSLWFDLWKFMVDSISFPFQLKKLTILGLYTDFRPLPVSASLASSFPNLTEFNVNLAVWAHGNYIPFDRFIGSLPIRYLNVGPRNSFTSEDILSFMKIHKDSHSPPTLETLCLHNFPFDAQKLESSILSERLCIHWGKTIKLEEMAEIRDLAEEMGIDCVGSAFEALAIYESDEYQQWLEDEEEEDAWTDDDYNDDDDDT